MSKTESTRNTCIVVVEVLLDDEATVIGALADSVEEVIDLEPDQIQPAPRIGTQIRTDFIKGMGKRETQFIMILDIDRVFSAEELAAVRRRRKAAAGRSGSVIPMTRRHRPARLSGAGFGAAAAADLPAVGHQSERGEEDSCWRAGSAAHGRAQHRLLSASIATTSSTTAGTRRGDGPADRCGHHQQDRLFREAGALRFSAAKALPELTAQAGGRELLIWSAGCSSGEEPYTMAMVLSEYRQSHPAFRFRILATDISTAVLERAERGVYSRARWCNRCRAICCISYFMRSRDPDSGLLRVVPELREAGRIPSAQFDGTTSA